MNLSEVLLLRIDLLSFVMVWFCDIMFVFSMGHQYKSVLYRRGAGGGSWYAARTTRYLCFWMRQMDFFATWKLSIFSIISPILYLFLPQMDKPTQQSRRQGFLFSKGHRQLKSENWQKLCMKPSKNSVTRCHNLKPSNPSQMKCSRTCCSANYQVFIHFLQGHKIILYFVNLFFLMKLLFFLEIFSRRPRCLHAHIHHAQINKTSLPQDTKTSYAACSRV